VSAQTRAKVRGAAQALGFAPNRLASELRRGAVSMAVGLVTATLSNPFYSQIAAGAERVLRGRGLDLMIASTDEDAGRERHLTRMMFERRVLALLIVPASADHAYLERERQLGTPIVFVDRPPVHARADTIVLDNRRAAAQATSSLLDLGHRRIGVIADRSTLWTSQERVAGAGEAMVAAGLDGWRRDLRLEAGTASAARAHAGALLAQPEPPTAILALNYAITAGVLEALRSSRQPCALIGFDGFDLAEMLRVTVVTQDTFRMGERAAKLALTRLAGAPRGPTRVLLRGRLVPHGSGELPPGRGLFA
jgi:LacI family transcriptional regulator